MKRFGIWAIGVITMLFTIVLFIEAIPGIHNYQFRLNLYVLWLMVAIACMVAIEVYLLRSRVKNGVTAWFSLIILTAIFWMLSFLFMAFAKTPEIALFWQHLQPIFSSVLPIMLTMFVISYVYDEGVLSSPILWLILPICLIIVIYVISSTGAIYPLEVSGTSPLYQWGYEATPQTYGLALFAWQGIVAVINIAILAFAYRKMTNKLQRKQTAVFLIAISQFILMAIAIDIIYYGLYVDGVVSVVMPPMHSVYTSILAFILGYGIIKYGVFKVNPAALSGTILKSLSEAVVAVNRDMVVEFTNKGTELITGYPESVLKGQHVSMLFDTSIYEEIVDRLHGGKENFQIEEIDIKNNQGSRVPVTLSLGDVRDDRGRQAGHIFVFANITELKKKTIELAREKASVEQKVRDRTQELSEERARLSASINSLKLGYLMTSADDEIAIMNPAARVILSRLAEEQHISLPSHWTLADVQRIFQSGADIFGSIQGDKTNRKPFEFNEIQLGKHFMYVFVAPVTEDNEVIGSVVLFEDITEQKAVARSKEEFFIIASHELRTPLTKIRGSAEIISDVYKSSITSDDAKRMLKEIERSSTHLIEIVNVIIEIGELEQGKVELRPEEFDIIELADTLLTTMTSAAGKSDIQTSVKSNLKQLHIVADKPRTEQVLMSFISNALKFTDDGSITIAIKPHGHDVRIAITDTGKGIKVENRSLLFRKFQQAGSSLLSRDGEGTGLGLYVVKLIVGLMGGDAGLESSEVNKGSTFYFTLPIRPASQVNKPKRALPKEV